MPRPPRPPPPQKNAHTTTTTTPATQVYLSRPQITELDGESVVLFPKDARLRNLT